MFVNERGMTNASNWSQSLKALLSILSKVFGKDKEVKWQHEKAHSPIDLSELEKVMEDNLQILKACSSIVTTELGMTTDET